jgi:hypothetical protein
MEPSPKLTIEVVIKKTMKKTLTVTIKKLKFKTINAEYTMPHRKVLNKKRHEGKITARCKSRMQDHQYQERPPNDKISYSTRVLSARIQIARHPEDFQKEISNYLKGNSGRFPIAKQNSLMVIF